MITNTDFDNLQLNDVVLLGSLRYVVTCNYLQCSGGDNAKIFKKLRIDFKRELCTKMYGYKAGSGEWPEYKSNDFEAATRIVKYLMCLTKQSSLTPMAMIFKTLISTVS